MSRLSGLDALRGIAALVVLWFHVHHSHGAAFYPLRGYLAVDFFFMLSGYVMARTYEGKIGNGLWFFQKRLRRLWPTAALGILIGLPIYWQVSGADFWLVATLNLLLIPTLWAGAAYPPNSPIWSIFFELFANALHGFWLHKMRTLHLTVVVAAAGCISLAAAFSHGSYSLGSNASDFLGGFPRVIFAYFLGVLLWRAWEDRPPIKLHPLMLLPISIPLFLPREPVGDFIFVALLCPIMLSIGVGMSPGRWASTVGNLSFPLYAVHRPILALGAMIGAGGLVSAAAAIAAAAVAMPLANGARRQIRPGPATTAPRYAYLRRPS